MTSMLFLPESDKEYRKQEVANYQWIFENKLYPAFNDIESEAKAIEMEELKKLECSFSPDCSYDEGQIAEQAHDKGLEHYFLLKLGEYNLFCSTVSTIGHLWEQHLRMYLHKEIAYVSQVDFSRFGENFGELKDVFYIHGIDIVSLDSWSKLKELRLLNNYIKHGEGSSADRLRKHSPKYFTDPYTGKPEIVKYRTTLLDTTMNIEESDVDSLFLAVTAFWDQLPERAYLDDEKLQEVIKRNNRGR